MNPNPWGAFAEGIASGISGGMNNYAALKVKALEDQREQILKKLDNDRKDAEVQIKTGLKLLDYVKDDPEAFGRAIGQLGTGLSHFSSSKEGEPNYLNQDYLSKIGEFVTQKEEGKKWLYNEKRNIESLVDKEVITEEQGLYRLYDAINKKGNELKVEQKVIDEVIKPFREGAKEEKEKQSLIQAGIQAGLTEEQAQIYAESEQGRAALQALMKETVSPTITDYDRWEKDPEAFEKYKEAGRESEPKDELSRHIERFNALRSSGKGDSFEAKTLEARIGKLTERGGMSFEVLPDGTVRMVQGSLGQKLPATQQFTQQSQLDRYNTVIDVIDTTIKNIEESPSRAGVIGSIRSLAQKAAGVVGDVSPDILADTMRKSVNAIPGLDDKQKGELSGYFDPAIPENEIYENTIALELAKLRLTAGGGGIRAIDRAFKDAKKDVAITGMFSSNEVTARLKKVREEFVTEKTKQEKRLTGGRSVVRTGIYNGKKVIEYSDGAIEYAD